MEGRGKEVQTVAEKNGQQGKPYDDRTRMRVIAYLSMHMSIAEIHRQTGVAESTVRNWKKQFLEDNPNALSELCAQKRAGFAAVAISDMEKAQRLLGRHLDIAEANGDELEKLIQFVKNVDVMILPRDEQKALIKWLQSIKLEDPAKLTTIIGTLYDKAALATGEPTMNLSGSVAARLEDT